MYGRLRLESQDLMAYVQQAAATIPKSVQSRWKKEKKGNGNGNGTWGQRKEEADAKDS